MKNKIFDFRLYLQGLGRLRVIGIALAILCLTVSVLVPTVRWLDGPSNYYRIEHPIDGDELVVEGSSLTQSELERLDGEGKLTYYKIPETISDRATIVPVTVASYFSPVLVLMMFAFLNKRKESDFYHAIPFTRGCVYTSFVAAILTWVWGVLIVSSLSAALVWALCPYVTFSFGGLLTHMLLACLNAALLAAFTTVAVSLTGTATTAVVTTLLVMWSWRLVLLFARMSLSDLLRITPINSILGGYLNFSFLLPISIIVGEVTTPMVIYAVVIMLALFALGGLLYSKRRSELAGRSVPGRLVHNLLRCLITLPLALLLTYQLNGGDLTTLLVIFICMLLVFYLYELLTTKSARRMFRATPWLGAVVAVCIVFTGVIYLSDYVERHERTDADRIKSVEFVNGAQVRENNVVINAYELSQICKTDDADVIAGVSEAWSKYDGWTDANEVSVTVRIKLKGGRTITRDLTFNRAEFATMMGNLQKKEAPKTVPSYDEVTSLQISSYGGYRSTTIRVSGQWRARLLQALEADYNSLTTSQKMELFAYNNKESMVAQLQFTTEKDGKTEIYSYGVHGNMPRTMSLLYEIYGKSAYGRAEAAKRAIRDWKTNSSVTIRFFPEDGKFLEKENVSSNEPHMNYLKEVLLNAIDREESGSNTGRRVIVYISGFNRGAYGNDYFDIRFPVSLTESEWIALFGN